MKLERTVKGQPDASFHHFDFVILFVIRYSTFVVYLVRDSR
jgi:hypothetical protein